MFINIVDLKEVMYTDQTGKFPYLSSKGNGYVMVGYHIDANYIFQEPMKNRTERQMIATYQRIGTRMQEGRLSIKKHILDNEISKEYIFLRHFKVIGIAINTQKSRKSSPYRPCLS